MRDRFIDLEAARYQPEPVPNTLWAAFALCVCVAVIAGCLYALYLMAPGGVQ